MSGAGALRRQRRTFDVWPGFVDALATLLMVIIFLLLVFVLAQFFLSNLLSGREQTISRMHRQIAELTDVLAMERKSQANLKDQFDIVSSELEASIKAKDGLAGQIASHAEALESEKKLSAEARDELALLNRQMAALREQLAALAAALEVSEKENEAKKTEIVALGQRLNVALAGKVEELARYRSEFFGKLREILGKQKGVRIEGDRFVFSSEVLFASGSAELNGAGKTQLAQLAATLVETAKRIPGNINWVLRVDGHTDNLPIKTDRFPSNWELSTARAISVLRFLASQGISEERMVAAGFGEFHPLDQAKDENARSRNRRIELRLDSK
jgi:chemotaxis protein MotB